MPPALGYITFTAVIGKGTVAMTCLLGDGSPTPTWNPNWQNIAREKRRSLTEWHGNDSLTISIPVIIDYFATQQGLECEKDCRALEKMMGQDSDAGEPPLIAFESGGVVPHDTHDASHLNWFIASVEWGDADRDRFGNRVRQAATIVVQEFVEDDLLGQSSATKRKLAKKRKDARDKRQKAAAKKRYVVRANDTLERIAARPRRDGGLGSSKRWKEIRDLNPRFRDPKKVLPVGTILKMP
jgi:hypothetical protein